MTELLPAIPTDLHLSPIRPVTREDGCTLYQPLDGLHPAAVWLSEGADPDPRQYRALYAADWPEGASG
jgi:hypothetical protein